MAALLGDVNVRNSYPPQQTVKSCTIALNGSLSDAIDLQIDGGHSGPGAPVFIQMPAAWDAAVLTFAASDLLAGTYGKVMETRRDGAFEAADANVIVSQELKVPAAAGEIISVDPSWFRGMRFIKVRSGTAGSAVNQTAARTIKMGVVVT